METLLYLTQLRGEKRGERAFVAAAYHSMLRGVVPLSSAVRPRVEELLEGGQEVGLEEFRVLIEAELPEMFRREVESLVEQWGSIELAATHDARWPSPAAP